MLSRALRKRRRRRNGISFKVILSTFIISIVCISVGYSYLYESLTVEGKGNLVRYIEPYSGDYSATYSMDTWYSDQKFYYNYNLNITNLTGEDVNGWEIIVGLPDSSEAVTSWNAEIEQDGNSFIFTNKNYNGTLRAGVESSFGFQFQSKVTGDWIPIYVRINGKKIKISNLPADIDPGDEPVDDPIYNPTNPDNPTNPTNPDTPDEPQQSPISVALSQTGSWGNGNGTTRQYKYTITNTSTKTIKSWKVKMSKIPQATIDGAWNMNYVEADDYILFSNGEWNGTIEPGKSIDLQFQIASTNNNYTMEILSTEAK